jgi:hypothetical protein
VQEFLGSIGPVAACFSAAWAWRESESELLRTDTCAEAFKRDLPEAEIHFVDTGHFALETHCAEIAFLIRKLMTRKLRTIETTPLTDRQNLTAHGTSSCGPDRRSPRHRQRLASQAGRLRR